MQQVFDLAVARMHQESATRIVRLRLRVGDLAGVIPEALSFAFDALKPDTPAAQAELEIERVPAQLQCRGCSHPFETGHYPSICPACGSWESDICYGQELDLVQVELIRET